MQQRLSELLLIPDQIQETLLNVAKTMQKFLPPGSLIVADPLENPAEEIDQYDDSYRFEEKLEEDPGEATDNDLENGVDELAGDDHPNNEENVEEETAEEEQEAEQTEPEPEKKNPFERNWPWSSQERNTFKRSNFQGYRSSSMIQNR